VEDKLNLIFKKLESFETEVKSELKELKTDVKELKTDVKGLKTDVKELKTDVKELKKEQEEIKEKIKDGFTAMNHCFNTVYDKIEKQKNTFRSHSAQLRDLTARIEDLEGTFKPETIGK